MCHAENIVSDETIIVSEPKANLIYEKIDKIALAKTKMNQYASLYSDSPDAKNYIVLVNEVEELRDKLTVLGTDPSEEMMN